MTVIIPNKIEQSDVFKQLEIFGRFHTLQYLLICLPLIMVSMTHVNYIFVAEEVEYRWDLHCISSCFLNALETWKTVFVTLLNNIFLVVFRSVFKMLPSTKLKKFFFKDLKSSFCNVSRKYLYLIMCSYFLNERIASRNLNWNLNEDLTWTSCIIEFKNKNSSYWCFLPNFTYNWSCL